MDRRKFLKMLGLGSLIPFVKPDKPEPINEYEFGYEGIEGNEPLPLSNISVYFGRRLQPLPGTMRYGMDGSLLTDEVYDFMVCEGVAEVLAVYRNGKTVDKDEYEQFTRWHGIETYTCVRFRKEQIDFHNKPYELLAEVKNV